MLPDDTDDWPQHQKRIVKYVDFDWKPQQPDPKGFRLFTEFCEHGDVAAMAEKRRLTRREIAEIIDQVVEGLEYLHGQNLSHGNLKPSNVLVKTLNPLSIVLTDAGSTSDERWVHEPHYLPPESARGIFAPEYAQAADIWALGVIALHLALGGMPMMEDPGTIESRIGRAPLSCLSLKSEW